MTQARIGRVVKKTSFHFISLRVSLYYRKDKGTQLGDVFIGYEKDTAASVVLQMSNEMSANVDLLDRCKHVLLQVSLSLNCKSFMV